MTVVVGQLGQDSTANLGDQAGEMAALAPVNLGAGRTATAVTAGSQHTCAVLDDATVKCWGAGNNGRLGQDSVDHLGDQAGEMAALAPVNLGVGRTATARHRRRSTTRARCWTTPPSNAGVRAAIGQLGQNSTAVLGDQAGEMAALPPINFGVGPARRRCRW